MKQKTLSGLYPPYKTKISSQDVNKKKKFLEDTEKKYQNTYIFYVSEPSASSSLLGHKAQFLVAERGLIPTPIRLWTCPHFFLTTPSLN